MWGLSRPLFSFLVLAFSCAAKSASLQDVVSLVKNRSLSSDQSWLRLLHFRKTGGSFQSDVDGPRFFLNPTGRTNAEAELQSFVEAIFDPLELRVEETKSVICRFPARWRWLQSQLADQKISWPHRDCPLLERYRAAVQGSSVSLVFSSYYLNNPSSAFGHTFLRVNKVPGTRDGQRYELLDYGFNFAANPETENALIFAMKGIFGGFPGTFTSVPYYYKVREYNNAESRDLWQYQLSLSPEKVKILTDHFWELGGTSISYWYLTQNCSFHMLTALEAADPDLDVVSDLKKFVVPSETIRAVMEVPGLVREITYRPSLRTQLLARVELLTDKEKDVLLQIVKLRHLKPLEEISFVHRQSLVLDAVMDLIDYKFPYEIQFPDNEVTQFKNRVLAARGGNPTVSEELLLPKPETEEPHRGHPSQRAGFGGRKSEIGEETLLLSHRFSFHDLDDPGPGYPESVEITMVETQIGWSSARQRLELERLNLFEVITRQPWSKLTPNWSWQARIGSERRPWDEKTQTSVGMIEGGAGITLAPPQEKISLFAGAKLGLRTDLEGRSNLFRGTMGPAAALRWRLNSKFSMGGEAWWRRERQGTSDLDFREMSATVHYQLLQTWGIRFRALDWQNVRSVEAQILKYF